MAKISFLLDIVRYVRIWIPLMWKAVCIWGLDDLHLVETHIQMFHPKEWAELQSIKAKYKDEEDL